MSPGCPVNMFGEQYALVESAYIAAKNPDFVVVRNMDDSTTQTLPFSKAVRQHESAYWLSGLKRLGKKEFLTELRPDWEHVKLAFMYEFIRQKVSTPNQFSGNLRKYNSVASELTVWLLCTPYDKFVEYNNWGDTIWGAVLNKAETVATGYNCLGGLYAVLRKEILTKTEIIPRITAMTGEDELRAMQQHLIETIAYLREHVQSEPLIRLESD